MIHISEEEKTRFIKATDAPVLPKPRKFQIGKAYKHKTSGGYFVNYTVTVKYTDGGTTYIVLDNKYIAKVGKLEIGEGVEYAWISKDDTATPIYASNILETEECHLQY